MLNQVVFHSLTMKNQEISKKLLRYLSGILTSKFKVGTAGLFASLSFPGRAGIWWTMTAKLFL